MVKGRDFKRENFDVSPEQQAEIDRLRDLLQASSRKDAILLAVRLALHLADETQNGDQVFIGRPDQTNFRRLLMLGIEKPKTNKWKYLVERDHPWKKELVVKGTRKLRPSHVNRFIQGYNMTPEEAAEDWDLPLEVILEIIQYCEENRELIRMEATEERLRLKAAGIELEPKNPPR
jgi:hypothetical protein